MSNPPNQPHQYTAQPPIPNQPGAAQAPVTQPNQPQKKSRTGLIIAVVVVIALVAGFFIVDKVVKSSVESSLRDEMTSNSEVQWEGLTTSFSGFPFLFQTFSGNYNRLDIHADSVQPNGESADSRFKNFNATLTGIKTGDKTIVDQLTAQGFMAFDDFPNSGDLGADATISGCDSNVCIQGDVDGRAAKIVISLSPSDDGLGFTIAFTEFSIEGIPDVLTEGLVGEEETIPLDPLPEGVKVSDIVVESDGILFKFEGTNVNISEFKETADTDN
ncbi:MAG: DUF2993 domain-containing protein [Actinomycetaceae bacterium]|nr:DUF2993 domain-containing protein [Actinomycetaceae bacterium]